MLKTTIKKLIYFILRQCPIKKNKVLFFSYYGAEYSCNPKYLSEYIARNNHLNLDLVWIFDNLNNKKIQGIRMVKNNTIKYLYELSTAKFIVTNFRTTEFFKKRKNQYYIQTWHSSLRLKMIEQDAEAFLPEHYIKMAKEDSKKIDLLISGSGFSTKIFSGSFWYTGEILNCGTPRSDFLLKAKKNEEKKVFEYYGLNSDEKILLYAPTFRKDMDIDVYKINYKKLNEVLMKKFNGKWKIIVRLHPHMKAFSKELEFDNSILDGTQYDDVQELMVKSDILITDYSALMFDFLLLQKPCFLYAKDLKEYIKNERAMYFNLEKFPFEMALDETALFQNIENYNTAIYIKNIENFNKAINNYETGKACELIYERILKEL